LQHELRGVVLHQHLNDAEIADDDISTVWLGECSS